MDHPLQPHEPILAPFYFLHYLLIGWTLAIVHMLAGWYRIFDLMDIWGIIFAGLAAVIALELSLKFWEAHGGRYGLEWLLAVLTTRIVKNGARA